MKKKIIFLGTILLYLFFFLGSCEVLLRAWKSLTYDGTLYLASPSINNIYHPEFGWISPHNFRFYKKDAIYGTGWVSYNEEGFRARPLSEAKKSDYVVFVLGDSVMQGFQMPNGVYFSPLLEKRLRKKYKNPYVLPLAVGGYGTLQEWQLFEHYYKELKPQLIVWNWSGNDTINNSYNLELCSQSDNNYRKRPYFEKGKLVYRRPYYIHISNRIDGFLTMKLLNQGVNKMVNKWKKQNKTEENQRKEAYAVAEYFIGQVASQSTAKKIALIENGEQQATEIYKKHGFKIASYTIPDKFRGFPRDAHPTPAGHQLMVEAVDPLL